MQSATLSPSVDTTEISNLLATIVAKIESPTGLNPLVDEKGVSDFLGCSVAYIRKDRLGKRQIPFVRVGGLVRYDLARVRESLIVLEEGATHLRKPKGGAR